MKATTVALSVYALDKTERVFDGISRRARALGGGNAFGAVASAARAVASALGVALAGVQSWAGEMSRLSDMAAIAGLSTEEITKLDQAFKILGTDVGGVTGITRMFARMTRTTGEQGMDGFRKVVGAISKIPDAAERAKVAQQVFGREAYMLGPIFDEVAQKGVGVLDRMTKGITGLSQAAVDAGDAVADAFVSLWNGAKAAFGAFVSDISDTWAEEGFDIDIRKSALRAQAYMVYYFRVGWKLVLEATRVAVEAVGNVILRPIEAIKRFLELLWAMITGIAKGLWELGKQLANLITGDGFDWRAVTQAFVQDYVEAWNDAKKSFYDKENINLEYHVDTKKLDDELDAKLKEIDDAFTKTGNRKSLAAGFTDGLDTTSRTSRRNEWLGGGTYRAATYAMRPEYGDVKSEVRGIRKLLESVEKNTKKTADKDAVELETL